MAARVCSTLLILSACVIAQSMDKVVQTDQGLVRGYKSQLGDFYTFYGIPYATAPTGRDKFKAPLPPPTWTDVFEATDDKIICPQPFGFNNLTREDCLVVNIYTPTEQQGPLSVIVYIHGGSFIINYGAVISPEYLMEHNVIIVHMNYRLGATGLLCLGTENIPGNAAFKDQVAALRWVQRNIANFGGKPDDVTLAGFSAGSISVEYVMLSPMAQGLFHKAISESGSALSPPSSSPDPLAFAKRFTSDIAGRTIEDVKEIEDYLLNATSDQLVTELYSSYQLQTDFNMGFTLCVEQKFEGVENFMTETPLNMLLSGNYNKVPYMTGITSAEGTVFVQSFDNWIEYLNEDFEKFLPVDLSFGSEKEKTEAADRIKQFYFKNEPVSNASKNEFVNIVSDIVFGYPMFRAVHSSVPVYMYYFNYLSNVTELLPKQQIVGARHCAQSSLVNRLRFADYVDISYSKSDILMRNRLTKLWSDFAKYGKPMASTSELLPVMWEQVDANRMNYLEMDLDLVVKNHLLQDRFQLWDELYDKFEFEGKFH